MKAALLVVLLVACSANLVTSHDATPASCQDVLAQGNTNDGMYEIDPDGAGGEPQFQVYCELTGGRGVSILHHDAECADREACKVDGFEEPGSFVKKVNYKGNIKQIEALIDLSGYCEQFLSYEAHASVIYWQPQNKNYAWWQNRNNRVMQNWGGAPTGTHGCGCSTEAEGCIEKKRCNADCNTHQLTVDSGYLNDKDNLPVTELHFGDTGTLTDDEYGFYKLGPIRCSGGPTHKEQEIPVFNTDTIYQYRYDLPRIKPGECRIVFEVKACNDAFIGFSEQEGEQAELIELNIGGWGNSKTVIRNCKQCQTESAVEEAILSCDEPKKFFVSWCTGTFTFGREGHGSLLSWNPPRSIHPTHVAFSTGYGATGTFSFDSFYSKEIHTCQNQKADINCGSRFVDILSAVYGRNSKEHCPHRYMKSTNCAASKSLEVVGLQCQGKHQCRLTVNNGVFGNPCCGTFKYLHAKYRCIDLPKKKRFTNDVCENNDCNPLGGQCLPLRGSDYQCSCKANFFGDKCEREYAMCRAWGDPHYTGFNGRNFDYQGMCKYTLATPCVDNENFLFRVVGVNKVASWNNRVSYNRGMELKIGGSDIVLAQGKQVQIDGAIVNAPCAVKDTKIDLDGKFLVVTNERLGVKVMWDGSEVFKIFAEKGMYGDNMCGLCGSIRAKKDDPFVMSNGTTTNDINAFGESWTANPFECPACKDCVPLSHCKDNAELLRRAKEACEPIRDPNAVFALAIPAGQDPFDSEEMFNSCVFDMCSQDKYDDLIRCNNMEEYANRIIQENRQDYIMSANAIVDWRAELDCPFNCPLGSVYSICASSCQRTCYQTVVRELCDMDCVEGCEPIAGFVLQNGIPVPETECGCRYGNDYYEVGQSWITKDCTESCACEDFGRLACFPVHCVSHAFCGSQNAVHGCHCESNYAGDGTLRCEALCPQFMGHEAEVRQEVDEGGHVVIFLELPIICEGYIRSFTIKRSNVLMEEVDFLVFRQHPDVVNKFIIVGSAHLTIDDDTMDLSLEDNEMIPVKAGDFVGIMSDTGTVFYDLETEVGHVLEAPLFDNLEPTTEVTFQALETLRSYSVKWELDSSNGRRVEPFMFNTYLGVQSGEILDSSITASTERGDFRAFRGRLDNSDGACTWTANINNQDQWLQVDLTEVKLVIGVVTQGHCGMVDDDADRLFGCVKKFHVQVSVDGNDFEYITDEDGRDELFDSKCSFHAHNKNFFKEAVNVRYVRFIPTVWTQSISMRVEIIGRDDADDEHQGVGLEARSLAAEDGTAILFVDRPFTRNGHVQGVRYFAAMPESFMLGVWRPTAVQTTFALIGRSYITSTGQGVACKSLSEKIPVRKGDVFGIVFDKQVIGSEPDANNKVLIRKDFRPEDLNAMPITGQLDYPESENRKFSIRVRFRIATSRTIAPVMSVTNMGLQDGLITSEQITSNGICDSNGKADRVRLGLKDQQGMLGGWCGRQIDQSAYIQIDFKKKRPCGGVITQGLSSPTRKWFVQKFIARHSVDMQTWTDVADEGGNTIMFGGNFDQETQVQNFFPTLLITQSIRIQPMKWTGNFPSMRMDVLGLADTVSENPEVGFITDPREDAGSGGFSFVIPEKKFSADGYVKGLYFRATKLGSFKFIVFREINAAEKVYQVVGMRHINIKQSQVELSVDFKRDQRLAVKKGDMIGFNFCRSVLYKTSAGGDVTAVVYARNREIVNYRSMKAGSFVQFVGVANRAYSVKALFEEASPGEVVLPVDAKNPVGLANGILVDTSITVSTTYVHEGDTQSFGPKSARLRHVGMHENLGGAWVADQTDQSPWLQVDFRVEGTVTGVITQGRHAKVNWWVTRYAVYYSVNCADWMPVEDANGDEMIFEGNVDSDTEVERYFPNAVKAQCIRVYPRNFFGRAAMRLEVLGDFEIAANEYGMTVKTRDNLDNKNFILLAAGIPFESDGYITEWIFWPKTSTAFKAGVWRVHPDDPFQFRHIGSNDIPPQTPNELATFQPDKTVQIPFRKGDVIGFSFTMPLVAFDEGEDSTDLLYSKNAGSLEPTPIGQYRRFESSGKQAYSIKAVVRIEPARDIPAVSCRHGLGMEDGLIPDQSIEASSLFGSQYTYSQARLNSRSSAALKGCWAPATDETDQYVQVDLGKPTIVTGVSVQGCNDEERWVTKLRVQLSLDGSNWEDALGTDGSKIFYGNTDSDSVVSMFFTEEAKVQFVRIIVQEWSNQIGLRFEVMGCPISCEKEWGANPLVRNWRRSNRDKSLVVNIKNPLSCNGYITGWKFVPKYEESVIFYVLQPVDIKKGVFTIVGNTYVQKSSDWNRGETVDVPLDRANWIEVRSGQMIGFYAPGRSPIYKDRSAHDRSEHMVTRSCRIDGFSRKSKGDDVIMSRYKKSSATYSFVAVLSQETIGDVKVLTPPIACSGGIGMESGRIPDDFIFSSSSNDPIKLGPGQARLNNDLAWQASPTDENIYLQVDIGYIAMLTGIVTQGDPVHSCWVTSYSVEYTASHDYRNPLEPTKFAWVAETNAIKEIFAGNSDQNGMKTNYFKKALEARVIRIAINDFKGCPAMRMEVLGCADPDTCSPNPCKQGAMCRKTQNSDGYTCNCPAEWGGKNCEVKTNKCYGWGDPHYGQFDGAKFNFMGACTYVLTRTVAGSTKDAFEVTAKNEQSPRQRSVSSTREVYTRINKRFYEFKQSRAVFVDNEKIRSPYEKDGVTIIDGSNNRVILMTDFGLRVVWDGRSKVEVYLTEDYKHEVEGLCGNYDGQQGPDYFMRSGEPTTDINKFGESWGVDELCIGCQDCIEKDECRENELIEEAQKACHVLINPHGPFSMCHGIISVDAYYKECTFDYCKLFPNMENLCEDIQVYADDCSDKKIQIGIWRTPGFCNYPCPVGMVTTEIGTECPNTCGNPQAQDSCSGTIGPMCVCAPDLLLEDGDRCVPIAECGCTYHGKYFKKGETFLADDCSESCFCNDEQEAECAPIDACHEQATCSVVKGARGCHCNPGWTGDGVFICDEILEPVHVTVCYNGLLTIDCTASAERIEILLVDYGTYPTADCPETLNGATPGAQDAASFILFDRCHNQEKCSFTVNDAIFGNFQGRDGKSLYVKYQCREEIASYPVRADTELISCEGNTLDLDCGFLKISVIRASYGRGQGDFVCTEEGDDTSTTPLTEDCIFKSAFRLISDACHGKQTCTITSDTGLFGTDACPTVSKYAKVQYQCVKNPDPRVLEDDKCDPNPCINGECESVSIEPKYNCKCLPGFTGTHCEIGKATCKALGDPHYITFDDVRYDFMGPCVYTLVKNADNEVKEFEVRVTNEKARRNPAMSSTVAVDFIYENHVIKLRSMGVTYIDDVITNGYTTAGLTISIDTPNVVVTTDSGIVIRWDGRYLVEVDVTGDYFNHVEGLCGNYNSDQEDDFTTRMGMLVDDPQKFGRSWNVEDTNVVAGVEPCVDCVDCVLPEPCADATVKGKAQEVCSQLIDASGPFQECHGTVDPATAYKNCMTDMCTMPDGLAYCEDYQFYAEECLNKQITISWRRADFCFIDCLVMNMVYSPKSPACPSNCANPTAALTCNLADRENCVCPTGQLKEGKDCVPIEKCGCVHEASGEYYRQGESVITKDCLMICSCNGYNNLDCKTYSCAANEFCGAKEGETLCMCEEGFFRDSASKKCLEIPFPQTLVIPQHQQAMIECQDERFINILDAHFGNPKQAEICLEVSGDQSCNAESSISRMKALCQNKHSCIPQALVKQFGDPCFEDFKYLHVEFSCVYEIVEELSIVTSIRACLGQSVSLLCDVGQEIFIEEFFFGRLANDGYCLKDGEALPAEDQLSATALETVRDLCHTKQSCLVQADSGTFGNPWAEGDEYMEITYKCNPQQ
ncbi:uncharacterized protein [Asterias amurensis]|uniref:uncharacterized protein n=1 Tax=Asterias amurensis TaxID=7602 RepID=UPI003AB26E14